MFIFYTTLGKIEKDFEDNNLNNKSKVMKYIL